MKYLKYLLAGFLVVLLAIIFKGGITSIDIQDNQLDSQSIQDSSLIIDKYNPISLQSSKGVLDSNVRTAFVLVHGFAASTFEMRDIHDWISANLPSVKVSNVLMGGHGQDLEDFSKSGWKDWQQPVLDEMAKIAELGFDKIFLIGASTGGTIILNALIEKRFEHADLIKGAYFVDPFLIAMDERLPWVGLLGPILGNVPNKLNEMSRPYWFTNRPASVFRELNDLSLIVQEQLKTGDVSGLPPLKIYQSKGDRTVKPEGTKQICEELQSKKVNLECNFMESTLHVMTRLRGRRKVNAQDTLNFYKIMHSMSNHVSVSFAKPQNATDTLTNNEVTQATMDLSSFIDSFPTKN